MSILSDAINAEIALLSRLATVPVASGYGRDLVCVDDLTPRMRETDPASIEALAQDCYHRVTTRRGSLPDDPDFGIDVLDWLSVGYTQGELALYAAQAANEIRKDDRVLDVTATVTPVGAALRLRIDVTPAATELREFSLIVNIDAAGTALEIL